LAGVPVVMRMTTILRVVISLLHAVTIPTLL
jgi:hypothetical protein